ncbi:hypothetical protein JOD82_001891 [Paenibacillus sp. 1182]|uniref:hypothetical protein n=1 Tax=Paenibacillus sp. 1182 TaxID=2806565 RepID=UPI001AEB9357|nr:hypothetical protein [Paenibacillus sp. 1182]MBP1308871.1 hypothetical protein [Paenibacillus sp. 1182]
MEQHLIETVSYNVPMMPVVVIRQNDVNLNVKTMHHIVYGKERIEQILYLIHKYENKDAEIKGDVPNLIKDFQEHFWHYEMVVHYVDPGLSDAELEQFLNIYQYHL